MSDLESSARSLAVGYRIRIVNNNGDIYVFREKMFGALHNIEYLAAGNWHG